MKDKMQNQSDHDLLIKLNSQFEDFIKRYDSDIRSINEGFNGKINESKIILNDHEKRILALEVDHIKAKTSLASYRIMGGFIGGGVMFLFTQLPSILRDLGIIK